MELYKALSPPNMLIIWLQNIQQSYSDTFLFLLFFYQTNLKQRPSQIPTMPVRVTPTTDLCMKTPPRSKAKRLVMWHEHCITGSSSPSLQTTKPCSLSDALLAKISPPSILTHCFTIEKGL